MDEPGDWSRPGTPRIEVPLAGDEAEPGPDDPQGTPNWRKIAGLSALAGVAMGLIAAVLIGWLADDDGDAGSDTTATTLDPIEAATLITTPPTLAPIATPTVTATTVVATTAETTTATEPSAVPDTGPGPAGDLTAITIPDFPALDGGQVVDLSPGTLTPAVAALEDDVPRQSTTTYQWAALDLSLTVDILRDPVDDRDRLTITSPSGASTVIVDHATDALYVSDPGGATDPDRWVRLTADEVLPGSGLASLRDLVEPQLLGPIRPDTIDDATVVEMGEVVSLGERGPIARRFVVTLRAVAAPEWVTYLFGPDWGRPIEGAGMPSVVAVEAYVSEAERLAVVNGRFLIDGDARGFTHRLVELTEREAIELPDPEQIGDAGPGATE